MKMFLAAIIAIFLGALGGVSCAAHDLSTVEGAVRRLTGGSDESLEPYIKGLGPGTFPAIINLLPEFLALKDDRRTGNLVSFLEMSIVVFGSDDPAIRRKGMEKLEELLSSSNPRARRAAVRALGNLGNASHIPKLARLLEDSNGSVRYNAAGSLGKLGTAATVPVLEAAIAKRKLGKSPREVTLDSTIESIDAAIAEIELKQGSFEKRVAALPRLLDSNPRPVLEAVGPESFPILLNLLPQYLEADHRRTGALVALLAHATDVFGAKDPAIRKAGLDKLEELLSSPNSGARSAAASGVAKVGGAEYIPKLLPLIDDPERWVRVSVAMVLADIGTPEVIPRLKAAIIKGKAGKTAEELRNDISVDHLERAVIAINKRNP